MNCYYSSDISYRFHSIRVESSFLSSEFAQRENHVDTVLKIETMSLTPRLMVVVCGQNGFMHAEEMILLLMT